MFSKEQFNAASCEAVPNSPTPTVATITENIPFSKDSSLQTTRDHTEDTIFSSALDMQSGKCLVLMLG